MKKIFCDPDLFSGNYRYNYLGNKLLHVFFLINTANKKNMDPVLPRNTVINEIFDIDDNLTFDFNHRYIKNYIKKNIKCGYKEISAFDYYNSRSRIEYYAKRLFAKLKNHNTNKLESIIKSKKQFNSAINFYEKFEVDENFYIKGHFWSYSLMPKQEILTKYLSLKKELITTVLNKYPLCDKNDTLVMHYRSRDYYGHLNEFYRKGIKLPKSYYVKTLKQLDLSKFNQIYCLSDDISEFKKLLSDYSDFSKIKFVENTTNIEDWVFIYLCKNIIQSNSSFCWTASLFNKKISFQPMNGYNYRDSNKDSSVPYDFKFDNSKSIPF